MSDVLDSDARAFPRKVFTCGAKLAVGEKAPVDVQTLDISLGGIGLIAPEAVNFGEYCVIKFEVEVGGDKKQFSCVAKALYCSRAEAQGFRTGFQFFRLDEPNAAVVQIIMNQA